MTSRLLTFAGDLSLGNFHAGLFVCELLAQAFSLENVRLESLVRLCSLGNFLLGSLSPRSQDWAPGLLRFGNAPNEGNEGNKETRGETREGRDRGPFGDLARWLVSWLAGSTGWLAGNTHSSINSYYQNQPFLDSRSLDLLTFWPWLQFSTKSSPEVLIQ